MRRMGRITFKAWPGAGADAVVGGTDNGFGRKATRRA